VARTPLPLVAVPPPTPQIRNLEEQPWQAALSCLPEHIACQVENACGRGGKPKPCRPRAEVSAAWDDLEPGRRHAATTRTDRAA